MDLIKDEIRAKDLQLEDLRQLVQWLALPYGNNMPIFGTMLPNGDVLETGVKLKALYADVVGEKDPTAGAWYQCPACGMMQVASPDLGDPVGITNADELAAQREAFLGHP
jgi:hypothetical protein